MVCCAFTRSRDIDGNALNADYPSVLARTGFDRNIVAHIVEFSYQMPAFGSSQHLLFGSNQFLIFFTQ